MWETSRSTNILEITNKDAYNVGLISSLFLELNEIELFHSCIALLLDDIPINQLIYYIDPFCIEALVDMYLEKYDYILAEELTLELFKLGKENQAFATEKLGEIYYSKHSTKI